MHSEPPLPSAEQAYPAKFYAALHTGTRGDLAFYRRQCAGATAILEFGCGYGRVLEAVAAPGRVLHGVDLHPGLLTLARTRLRAHAPARATALGLHEADMTQIDLGRRFDRVLLPHSGVYCLPDEAGVRRCFDNARAHLRRGGRLILDAYAADHFHRTSVELRELSHELGGLEVDGRHYRLRERSVWQPTEQRITVTYVHTPTDGSPAIETSIEHHYLLRPQLTGLLEAAGFRVLDRAPGWTATDAVAIVAEARS